MISKTTKYVKAKISAKDLLDIFNRLYGPVENLKFEWESYYVVNETDKNRELQLADVIQKGFSSTFIEFEIKLWDFNWHEDELESMKRIEDHIRISEVISDQTNGPLPLTYITARFCDLDTNGIPSPEADIWLEYGCP